MTASSISPKGIPTPAERFAQAVLDVECAIRKGVDAEIRDSFLRLGKVAYDLSHGIEASLRHTAKTAPRLT